MTYKLKEYAVISIRKGLVAKLVWILKFHKTWLHIAVQHFDQTLQHYLDYRVYELFKREQQN